MLNIDRIYHENTFLAHCKPQPINKEKQMKTVHFCELCGFQSTDKKKTECEERTHVKPKFKEDERVFYNEDLPWRPWRRIMNIRYRQEEREPVYDLEVSRYDYPNRGRDMDQNFLISRIYGVKENQLESAEQKFRQELIRRRRKHVKKVRRKKHK